MSGTRRSIGERLFVLVLSLLPPRQRETRSEQRRLFRELVASAPDRASRRRVVWWALRDAMVTVGRAWLEPTPWARQNAGGPVGRRLLGQHTRYGLRMIRRRPVASAVVVSTLALAIGANAAILAVGYAVLFDTLPYADADRVVWIERGSRHGFVDMSDAGRWRPHPTFAGMSGVSDAATYLSGAGANLGLEGALARRLTITHVSASFLDTLGVRPALGRAFTVADGNRVAVISDDLWAGAFGRDPAVVGRGMDLNGLMFTVLGVLPPRVTFPGVTEVWLPLPPVPEFFGGAYGPELIARLDEATPRPVMAERLQAVSMDPDGSAVRLQTLRDHLSRAVKQPVLILVASAAVILILGCLNLAGIFVSTLDARRPELDTRRALGASRRTLFVQLMTEVVLLALAGGLSGGVLARVATEPLHAWLGVSPAVVSWPVTAGAFVAATAATVLVGVLPAWRAARAAAGLNAGRRVTTDLASIRLQHLLAVGQVALAILLVVGASLLGRSLVSLTSVPLGFDTDRVLTFEVALPAGRYEDLENRNAFIRDVEARLAVLPGVERAGATSQLPLDTDLGVVFPVRAETSDAAEHAARWLHASPDYFAALGTRILAGRTFAPNAGVGELVIDDLLAHTLFGTSAAVGRRVVVGQDAGRTTEVIGVVEHVEVVGPTGYARGLMFEPLSTLAFGGVGFAVRVDERPETFESAIRAVVADVDPAVAPFEIRSTRDRVARDLATRRSLATVSFLFGVAAAAIAALGLYGVIARSVVRRRRELGIRLALGASGRQLVAALVRAGLVLAVVGASGGVLLTMAMGRWLESLLFGVRARDPVVLSLATAGVIAVTLVAVWVPARRAARLSPVEALAHE